MDIETETETRSSHSETSTIDNNNFDIRDQAVMTLDQNAQIGDTGQLDFRNVLAGKSGPQSSAQSSKPELKKQTVNQIDFRDNLKGGAGDTSAAVNLERKIDDKVQQIDFRSMLKNKTNTKTQSEHEARRQQAAQIDFRGQLGKK